MQTQNSLKGRLKYSLKISFPLLPHWLGNSQGKNGECPIITPAMNSYDGIKMGHIISCEWCLFLRNQFQCFKVECLVVLIIFKKSGIDKVSRKY